MKRRIKIVALALITFLSTLSYAESKNAVEMKVMSARTFALIINDISKVVQIQLVDQDGYLLHNENILNLQKYAKLYDVSALSDGRYQLILDYEIKTEITPIEILNDQVLIKTAETIEIFKPTIFQKNKMLTVSLFTSQKKSLNVNIYDRDDQLIHEDKLSGKATLGRRYDLSTLPQGKYRVNLTSDGRSYNHYIVF